jgi:hypothetical protein
VREEVEESNRIVTVRRTQRVAHARAASPPDSEIGQKGERHRGRRAVQCEPGDVGRVDLTAGERLVLARQLNPGRETLEQLQRLRLAGRHLREKRPRRSFRETRRQMLKAPSVARDDRPLLARERAQRIGRDTPRLELEQVAMLGQYTLDRS